MIELLIIALSVDGQRQEHEEFVLEYTEKLDKAESQV